MNSFLTNKFLKKVSRSLIGVLLQTGGFVIPKEVVMLHSDQHAWLLVLTSHAFISSSTLGQAFTDDVG